MRKKQTPDLPIRATKDTWPILGYLFEPAICLLDEFREDNESPAAGHVAFYRQFKERMAKGKRIACTRTDSASYQAEFINELEEDKVLWTITADQDAAVQEIIRNMPEEAWREPEKGCGYEFAEAVHAMKKTKASFRLVIKREMRT